MEEVLYWLLENESMYLINEENMRKITLSTEVDGWDIFNISDSMNPILSTENIDEAIDCFEYENI